MPPIVLAGKLANEETCIAQLRVAASLPDATARGIERDALALARQMRDAGSKGVGVETFLAEFDLSTDEGVALMCLAEALLRIPDTATIDALIGDKLGAPHASGSACLATARMWPADFSMKATASA
jgi:RHH-type proline utilization regulon transcriptional repressor/proline dehydrogenase/delta 1-pyrroline-5-carboxylate dehydrogenase